MVCGIASLLTLEWCIPGIVLGVMGIVLGGKAKREIMQSQGSLKGDGMAVAGVICGVFGVIFSFVVGVLFAAVIGFGVFLWESFLY
jgi:hypothetical protein